MGAEFSSEPAEFFSSEAAEPPQPPPKPEGIEYSEKKGVVNKIL